MTQIELARLLGISNGYLWKIYNGYAKPSKRMAERLWPQTGKNFAWWVKARTSDIQKMFDRIMEVRQ